MKIVVSNNQVKYAFSEGADVLLTDRLVADDIIALDMNSANAQVITTDTLPADWRDYACTWNGTAVVKGVSHLQMMQENDPDRYAEVLEDYASTARTKRDKLLLDCDWVAVKSFETSTDIPAAFTTYRQALRDITAQTGFPLTIEWPTQPE